MSPITPELAPGRDKDVSDAGITYEQFIVERHKILDGRSRAQQRVDQLVTGGAAGALVLSITLMEKIAPSPTAAMRPILLGAWGVLLLSLGLSLSSHYASCYAFDAYLRAFDQAYKDDSECTAANPANQVSKWLERGSALAFVVAIALLGWFAYLNVQFTAP
jgi:hypothetical protein